MSTTSSLLEIILSEDDAIRNQSLAEICAGRDFDWMIGEIKALDEFRRNCDNLYHRVRALFFLSAMYRYDVPKLLPVNAGRIPHTGFTHLLNRRFSEAINVFQKAEKEQGLTDAICSALAASYHQLGFQTLADQVRKSVKTFRGNQWMFRVGHPLDQPLRIREELLQRSENGPFPILKESTSVRMDLSHSAWSDIFFLGMDFPEGARVLNISVDLAVRGRDDEPRPPIEVYLRVIDKPVLRLVSTDLNAETEIENIDTVFDFARDYLGLLKAAVIAAGLVPPGLEGCGQSIESLFSQMIGPGLGLEIVSKVNDIPKGSRLAVSTNLLGSLISVCMRATGQVSQLFGGLEEDDRRTVAARAILGEWIGGSGGGWQDSGGVWPGIKMIAGTNAQDGDPEFGISRGCLLPRHRVLDRTEVSDETRKKLSDSLVVVHGGMAQNVGPILEMVTEKYLIREKDEWVGRQNAMKILDAVQDRLKEGDVKGVGSATTKNFFGPLQTIIPWCSDRFTELLIERSKEKYGEKFWGFWMLGGMAGGGMGFIFDPSVKEQAQDWIQAEMIELKGQFENSLPFAMTPVVYDFKINDRGSWCDLLTHEQAEMPNNYYALLAPKWLRSNARDLSQMTRLDLERFGSTCLGSSISSNAVQSFLGNILPQSASEDEIGAGLNQLLKSLGFDREAHEQIRSDLIAGRIGLSQNRLAANALIEDVSPDDVLDTRSGVESKHIEIGKKAIANGEVAVVTLAAGVGSRWTEGAGVVKALHPFCKFDGRHRSFLEVHLAKSRKVAEAYNHAFPHVFTTSYLTLPPIRQQLADQNNAGYPGKVVLSEGRSVGLRMIPMVRDLNFVWEEVSQQVLDEQQQKMRTSLRSALTNWARSTGEGSDYTDNIPSQCLHPVGHWYEIPNMLRNGTLKTLLADQPNLKYLLLHNIDTLGASIEPGLLGSHIASGNCLSFEVIARRLEDHGGGLAKVNGQVRILEGMALPREEDEFKLSFYNSMTTWIDIDQLLRVFELSRADLNDQQKVDTAVRELSRRIPTYTTVKDVKKRWGNGQEDVFPVSQFEKLWSDMTSLPEISCGYFVVELGRGQQLKEQAQLDGWMRDGTAEYVNSLCQW